MDMDIGIPVSNNGIFKDQEPWVFHIYHSQDLSPSVFLPTRFFNTNNELRCPMVVICYPISSIASEFSAYNIPACHPSCRSLSAITLSILDHIIPTYPSSCRYLFPIGISTSDNTKSPSPCPEARALNELSFVSLTPSGRGAASLDRSTPDEVGT